MTTCGTIQSRNDVTDSTYPHITYPHITYPNITYIYIPTYHVPTYPHIHHISHIHISTNQGPQCRSLTMPVLWLSIVECHTRTFLHKDAWILGVCKSAMVFVCVWYALYTLFMLHIYTYTLFMYCSIMLCAACTVYGMCCAVGACCMYGT